MLERTVLPYKKGIVVADLGPQNDALCSTLMARVLLGFIRIHPVDIDLSLIHI